MQPNGSRLERKFEAELDEARVVYSRVDRAEAGGTDVVDRHAELRMVKKVEKFCAKIQAHVLPWQRKLFDHGEVGVDKIWTYDRHTGRVSELTRSRCDKAGRLNPFRLAVVGGIGTAASNLVWAGGVIDDAGGGECGG